MKLIRIIKNYIKDNYSPNYKHLELLPYMKEKIKTRINILGKEYVSVHMRRTDYSKCFESKSTKDDEFINFLNKYKNTNKNIYLATDNKKTHDKIKQKYKNQIKFEYHKIKCRLYTPPYPFPMSYLQFSGNKKVL